MAQLAESEALKNDSGLKQEIEFEQMFPAMLVEYGVGLHQVIEILDPIAAFGRALSTLKATRRPRLTRLYKKPHSGEVVETRGGNHKILNEWKAQYGADTAESWLERQCLPASLTARSGALVLRKARNGHHLPRLGFTCVHCFLSSGVVRPDADSRGYATRRQAFKW